MRDRTLDAVLRAHDLVLGGIATLLLSPVLIGVAVALWLSGVRPVLFRHPRPGRNARIFTLLKFRSMTDSRDSEGRLLPDADRITPIGRIIRKTSVDELPSLINVLKGEMSLVGPRPLLPEYLPRYTAEEARRHEVRPGVTGWAQVNGRNAISWEEKFALDVWYVDNRSVALYWRILWLTVLKTVRAADISAEGHATMPIFDRPPPGEAEKDGRDD